jgi:hypothetical protein
MEADLIYYRRRSAQEAAAATFASNSKAKIAHLELARLYSERIDALQAEPKHTELHLVGAA